MKAASSAPYLAAFQAHVEAASIPPPSAPFSSLQYFYERTREVILVLPHVSISRDMAQNEESSGWNKHRLLPCKRHSKRLFLQRFASRKQHLLRGRAERRRLPSLTLCNHTTHFQVTVNSLRPLVDFACASTPWSAAERNTYAGQKSLTMYLSYFGQYTFLSCIHRVESSR